MRARTYSTAHAHFCASRAIGSYGGPNSRYPHGPVVPARRHGNRLLVVAQRQPWLFRGHRLARLPVWEQRRDVGLVPPRRPLWQPTISRLRPQELQKLRRGHTGRPLRRRQPRIDEQAAGNPARGRLDDHRHEVPLGQAAHDVGEMLDAAGRTSFHRRADRQPLLYRLRPSGRSHHWAAAPGPGGEHRGEGDLRPVHRARDGYRAVANELTQRGYRPRSGRRWSSKTVTDTLRNPAYIRTVAFREMRVADSHPAIIEPKTFALADALLTERGVNRAKAASVAFDYHLTGKIIYPRWTGLPGHLRHRTQPGLPLLHLPDAQPVRHHALRRAPDRRRRVRRPGPGLWLTSPGPVRRGRAGRAGRPCSTRRHAAV